jgi:hypothetical protein
VRLSPRFVVSNPISDFSKNHRPNVSSHRWGGLSNMHDEIETRNYETQSVWVEQGIRDV